ncbi:MAG TPA: hypothetical protein VH593_31680 [Ktedonobacteraceae bacterium]|jgi:hypothetical protein
MSIATEQDELTEIINNICRSILQLVSAKGEQGAELRRRIGLVRVNGLDYLQDKVFGNMLWDCFVIARTLPITADRVAYVREQISKETPTGMIAILVVETAIIFCLTTECIFLTQTEFKSRDDVSLMMKRMKTAFDKARDQAADRMDSASYQNLSYLAGSIINHLNSVSLTLPRMVKFEYQINWPALRMAHLIYQDTTRSEELIAENKVVHPLFMPRSIIGLTA